MQVTLNKAIKKVNETFPDTSKVPKKMEQFLRGTDKEVDDFLDMLTYDEGISIARTLIYKLHRKEVMQSLYSEILSKKKINLILLKAVLYFILGFIVAAVALYFAVRMPKNPVFGVVCGVSVFFMIWVWVSPESKFKKWWKLRGIMFFVKKQGLYDQKVEIARNELIAKRQKGNDDMYTVAALYIEDVVREKASDVFV